MSYSYLSKDHSLESQDFTKRPNIILMMADDLGWGDVGFNGNTHIKTPNLDTMANNGINFTRFYSASPLCSPARGSCLTGRHPWRFGVLSAHTGGMRIGEKTIAEVTQSEGYATGFFGKWHLGWVKPEERLNRGYYSPPWHHHFEEVFATASAVPTYNPTVTPKGWNAWGQVEGTPWKNGTAYVHNGIEVTENLGGDDSRVIMDRVLPFIHEKVNEDKSFFACVWFHAPHEPVVAGPEYLKLYPHMDEEQQHYYGCITAMDEQIGRLRQELRDLGIEKETLLFFTSDNGPADDLAQKGIASSGPYRGHKHTMYEGGMLVPSLAEWPDHISAGQVSDVMCGTVDYMPTILDVMESDPFENDSRPLDGMSLFPLIRQEVSNRTKPMFFGHRRLYKGIDGQAYIENDYKLLKRANAAGNLELYCLSEDPYEENNLADKLLEKLEDMKIKMSEYDESCRMSRDGADYEF